MRLCYVCPGSFAHVGAYLDYFHRAGHEVSFVALSPSPPRAVATYQLGLGKGGKWQYAVGMLRARSLVRRLRPDVVHAHYATSGGLAGLVCGFRPTIVTAHGTDLAGGYHSPARRALLRAVFKGADCVNPVSEELKNLALGLGVPRSKLRVLTPGVDMARFAAGRRRPRAAGAPLRLICTRRLEALYDPGTIVEALVLLRERGVRFRMTFAGDGPERARLESRVGAAGLTARVRFLGEVTHDSLPGLLAEHDVYLSASRRDGTSLSLLEAMAAGLLPVVSSIPANAAWLAHGVGGLLHKPGDAKDLARLIQEAADRPELAESAAAVNADAVARRGDRDRNMKELEALYADLIRDHRD